MFYLQVTVSLIFFGNKVLVLAGKRIGWLAGVIAAALAAYYFLALELYIYTILEFGLIVVMGYGFLHRGEDNPNLKEAIEITIALVMIITTIAFSRGILTIVELASALELLLGTYFLTQGRMRVGWLVCAMAHAFAGYLGHSKQQDFFAFFQYASVVVSLVGAVKN